MIHLRSTLALILTLAVLLLSSSQSQAEDKQAKKKKGNRPVVGTIADVTKDMDKESGTIKVSIKGKKKQNTEATEKTFKVTAETKIEKAAGKKKDQTPAESVKFSSLSKDQHVRIEIKGDTVEKITILRAKGKKKNAA